MPAKGPVSLTWQTIFCFIPIMDIVASYRVRRMRWYLLIITAFNAISTGVQLILIPFDEDPVYDQKVFSEETGFDWGYAVLGGSPELTIGALIVHTAIAYAIAVYLIRRWSKKWNLRLA